MHVHPCSQRRHRNPDDTDRDLLIVSPCLAHLSPVPFGGDAPWGGHAWRSRREFVGSVSYRARNLLWNPSPKVHARFPPAFRKAAMALLCGLKREESPLYALRPEHAHIILNGCGYDWWGLEGLEEKRQDAFEDVMGDARQRGGRPAFGVDGAAQAIPFDRAVQEGGALQCLQQ